MHRIISYELVTWLSFPALVLLLVGTPEARAASTFYSTEFEASEGFDPGMDLAGQNGWDGTASGWNGLVSGYFPALGQQAYVGFSLPAPTDQGLFVWRSITHDPVEDPKVRFSVLMEIIDSSRGNTNRDVFSWIIFNAQGDQLFAVDFDNRFQDITYQLDGTNELVVTKQLYPFDRPFEFSIVMDYEANLWTAEIDGVSVTNMIDQPITTTNAPLDLGDVDASWWIIDTNAPGDNFMVFDNYRIMGEPPPVPEARLEPLGFFSGNFAVRLFGMPDTRYVIEATTNLVDWTALHTNLIYEGYLDFVDDSAGTVPQKFYRGRLVP